MILEQNKTGIKLHLEELSEKVILTYTSELNSNKKVSIIIEPALNKTQPRLQIHINKNEYSFFESKDNEDLYCVVNHGLTGNWTEL